MLLACSITIACGNNDCIIVGKRTSRPTPVSDEPRMAFTLPLPTYELKERLMPEALNLNIRTIVVAGDVTVDWNVARARAHLGNSTVYQYIWGSDIAARACSQSGGAALLTELLTAICENLTNPAQSTYTVIGPAIPQEALHNPSFDQYTRSYTVWSAYPQRVGASAMVWRASEFWGIDRGSGTNAPAEPKDLPDDPWGLVLDDANLGFRDRRDAWPESVAHPSRKTSWVLVKAAHPVARGPLWEQLIAHYADRLVVVVAVSDLRKANLQIGYGLSWEQISSEVIHAVTNDPDLSKPSAVVVTLGTTGAVVVHRTGGNNLIFDPYAHEEDWRRDHPGMCIGYTSCYVAGLVRELMTASGDPQLCNAVKQGVYAARILHQAGYAEGDGRTLVDLRFPVGKVTEALGAMDVPLATVRLSNLCEGWTILSRRRPLDIKNVAADVLRSGPEASLADIPLERIGSWASADRTEIEHIRSLRNIMAEYVAQPHPLRPLSLAVFGPPGSGKSFAVKEIARALMPGRLNPLEFNLSQFESHEELPAALHRIRDAALRHELPLVFWDEFDTPRQGHDLGWLRYFLAPMQDGEFREGGLAHPIGPAVFIFAGGVHATMASFRKAAEANPAAKGRDFLSRLRGFLNILGLNPHGEGDEAWPLRRALLLRSLLLRKAEQLFDTERQVHIDEGVLRAFLQVGEYRHGARSMESIIDMSALSGKLMFERSCLPAPHQLGLHVDAAEFLQLVSNCVS